MTPVHDVVIVGAGLAGLAAARDLLHQGLDVVVLEKSRGVSGRAATRRLPSGASLDHGARFFTVRGERLQRLNAELQMAGVVRTWTHGLARLEGGVVVAPAAGHARFACVGGMNQLGKFLAQGLDVRLSATVQRIAPRAGRWVVRLEDGAEVVGRAVLVTAPAPQAVALLPELDSGLVEPSLLAALQAVQYAPCWAAMFVLRQALGPEWPALEVIGHERLAWLSQEHSKRNGKAPFTLLAQATPTWSRDHLEMTSTQACAALELASAEVLAGLGANFEVSERASHRWRYALPVLGHNGAFLAQDGLVLCGDWCLPNGTAPRIEAALEAGWAAAAHLVAVANGA